MSKMTILSSQVQKFNTHGKVDHLQVLFLYPKLVIFEDSKIIRILDIEAETDDERTKNETSYYLDHYLIDHCLHDHFLWLILKSGELMAIDILQGSQLKIVADAYRPCKMQNIDGSLYLISESGDWLKSPFTSKELDRKLAEGIKEVNVSLEKTRKLCLENYTSKSINGLQIYTELGAIKVKCPLTGLCEVIPVNVEIDHVVPWGDQAVLGSNSKMWLIDLANGNIIHEFQQLAVNYYPVTVWNNNLYYVLWDKEEVRNSNNYQPITRSN